MKRAYFAKNTTELTNSSKLNLYERYQNAAPKVFVGIGLIKNNFVLKYLFIFFTILVLPGILIGQQLPTIIPPSPNAQQFQKYGDYPVSYFTGVPEINIPIYTIKEGDLEVPISISYHASGIKINDKSGYVGLGWTLMAGGMISRSIVGKADPRVSDPNVLKKSADINPRSSFDLAYLFKFTDYPDINLGDDGEFDIFSYGINSLNGKFIINNVDGKPALFPYKPIKITPNLGRYWEGNFEINDENGILYRFGESLDGLRDAKESYSSFTVGSRNYSEAVTSWLITDMVSATDATNTIQFAYQDKWLDQSQFINTDNFIYDDELNGGMVGEDLYGTMWHRSLFIPNDNGKLDVGISNYILVPSEIRFKNGKITFTQNPTSKMLSRIDIYDYRDNIHPLQSIVFNNTTYFLGSHRNCLKSIEFRNKNDLVVNKYSFKYHDEDQSMPNTGTNSIDFWGYFNGKYNPSLLHNWTDYSLDGIHPIGNANRSADEVYMKRHVLETITYPTGGRSDFDYEANRYWDGEVKQAGGLRIKNIKSYDANGILALEKTYKYNESGGNLSGTGLIPIIPESKLYRSTQVGVFNGTKSWCYNGANTYLCTLSNFFDWFRRRSFSSEPNVDLAPLGSPVVYPEVTEYIGDATGNTGKTVYSYDVSTIGDVKYDTYANNYISQNVGLEADIEFKQYMNPIKYWNVGQLLGKTVYDMNGKLVEGDYNVYYPTNIRNNIRGFHAYRFMFYINLADGRGFDELDQKYAIAMPSSPCNCGYFEGGAFVYSDYYIPTGDKKLKNTIVVKDGVTTTTEFKYDNSEHIFPTQKITTNSKDETFTTYYKYPHDFKTVAPYNEMVSDNKHIWAPIIEQSDYKGTGTSTPLQSVRTNYGYFQTNTIMAPQTVETKKGTNNYETRLRYYDYDINGHVLSVSKENDVKNSYIWGYNQTTPIAKAVGASNNEIYFTSYEDNPQVQCWFPYSFDNTHSKTGNYSLLSSNTSGGGYYYFSPYLDISNSVPKKYKYSVWAYSNAPSFALYFFMKPNRDNDFYSTGWQAFSVNSTQTNKWVLLEGEITVPTNMQRIYLRVDASSGGKVWFDDLRLHPSNSQMTTYTYDPLIGMTSSTDENNLTTGYTYDSFGRLKLIKDDEGNSLKNYNYHYYNQTSEDVFDPQMSIVNSQVAKTIQYSTNNNGTESGITTYTWDFGDGTFSSTSNGMHTYSNWGTYNVTLTVTNSISGTLVLKNQVSFLNLLNATMSITANAYHIVSFTGEDGLTSGSSSTYTWNFGDGSTFTGKTGTHTFTACGNFTITLTVTNPTYGSSVKQQPINFPNLLNPSITSLTANQGLISFSGTDGIGSTSTSYSWVFSDGGSFTGATGSHSFATSGTYTVTLNVWNMYCSKSISQTITVTIAGPTLHVITNGPVNRIQYCNGSLDNDQSAWAYLQAEGLDLSACQVYIIQRWCENPDGGDCNIANQPWSEPYLDNPGDSYHEFSIDNNGATTHIQFYFRVIAPNGVTYESEHIQANCTLKCP